MNVNLARVVKRIWEIPLPPRPTKRIIKIVKCTKKAMAGWQQTKSHRTARQIAKEILGRQLEKDECVHHINMKWWDNRSCNLMICTKSYHMWLHFEYGRAFARNLT